MCYISKILKNESNSQPTPISGVFLNCCVISQRYLKMKAIHNDKGHAKNTVSLCYISKILKNESNSQLIPVPAV